MPLHDWQFWTVSLLAALGLWIVARPFLPRRKNREGDAPACPNCALGSASMRKHRKVSLTIERKRI
jgi:hypothetical protein